MRYLYETHLHTSQASLCAHSTGRDYIKMYRDLGYQGIMVTDHFFRGNTAVPHQLSWRERVDRFCMGYEDALEAGLGVGLDVFFGWEENFGGDEYLIYGLDKPWLYDHPQMASWTRKEQYDQVHESGGCVVQAHPFRYRRYIPRITLSPYLVDGVEIGNGANTPYSDAYAALYAKAYDLSITAGSDIHKASPSKKGYIMGVAFPRKLTSIHDYVRAVINHEPLQPLLPENHLKVPPEPPPFPPVLRLNANEEAEPFHL